MSAELLQDKAALQDKQHAWWASGENKSRTVEGISQ